MVKSKVMVNTKVTEEMVRDKVMVNKPYLP